MKQPFYKFLGYKTLSDAVASGEYYKALRLNQKAVRQAKETNGCFTREMLELHLVRSKKLDQNFMQSL